MQRLGLRMAEKKDVLCASIVGCGNMGGLGTRGSDGERIHNHAAAYDRHDGFCLADCVEPDEVRRKAYMAEWNVAQGYACIEDAVAAGETWDVVSICTPTARHAADLRALLRTSVRAVWCEKPLTHSAGESAGIVESYERAGKRLAVSYVRRWHPAMARLRRRLDAGEWGEVRSVVGYYTRGLRNNGSHLIDLIQFLVGPLQPIAGFKIRGDGSDYFGDPTVDAVLRASGGVSVHLVGGDARDYALFEVEIIAAQGSVRIERSGRAIRERRPRDDPDAAGYRILDDGQLTDIGTGDVFLRVADNLYRAVTDGAPLECDGRMALSTETICDALLERLGALEAEA